MMDSTQHLVPEQLERLYEPLGSDKIRRFHSVAESDRRTLSRHRENRIRLLRNMTGKDYHGMDGEGYLTQVPMNLLAMFLSTYAQQLAGGEPRANVRTEYNEMTAIADDLRVRLDYEAASLNLRDLMKEVVTDALIGLGVVKIALGDPTPVEVDGEMLDNPKLFVSRVHFDDLLIDSTARSRRELRYVGDKRRMPMDEFKERYRDGLIERLGSEDDADRLLDAIAESAPQSVDDTGTEMANSDHLQGRDHDHDLEKMVEVWDVYFCREQVVVTMLLSSPGTPPLQIREYDGPEPYHILSLGDVPDHVLPLPPAQTVGELHTLVNLLYSKLMADARDQKSVTVYDKGAQDDAEALRKAGRNEVIGVNSPDSVKRLDMGGINPALFGFAMDARDQFGYFSGNLEALAGLGPQSGTVGQEEIIRASASARVAQMQQDVEAFMGHVFSSLAYYIWTDPLEATRVSKTLNLPSGQSLRVAFTYSATGELEELQRLTIKVEPYSMQQKTPQQVVQEMMSMISGFWLQVAPLVAQQGGQIDWRRLNNLLADNLQLHELKDVMIFKGQPIDRPQLPEPGTVGKPSATTREYVRRDRGQDSRKARRQEAMSMINSNQEGAG